MPTLSEQVSSAVTTLEDASTKAQAIVETDAVINTEAGQRDSLPMVLRKAKEALKDLGPYLIGTFENGGVMVTNSTQVVRLTATGDDYRWDGAYPKTVTAGTVAANGGEGVSLWVNVGAVTLRQEVRDGQYVVATRLAKEAGLNMVGRFEGDCTVTTTSDVVWNYRDNKYYSYTGPLPNTVLSGFDPASSNDWSDKTDISLIDKIPVGTQNNISASYNLPKENGGVWQQGEVINISDWRVYNDKVWSSNVDSAVCGLTPLFGDFYIVDKNGLIRVENCGDVYAADPTPALVNAIKSAKSADKSDIYIDTVLTPATLKIDGAGDIYWHGSGSTGLYGVFVDDGSAKPIDFLAKLDNFPALTAAANPVVVVVGDSISAYKPDALNTSQTLYELITQKFSQSFPDKNFTFYDRAIGGQTIGNFNTTSSSNVDAPWYTVGTTWIPYVSALTPDVIVIHFGMNDTTESTLPQYISVIAKLQAFPKIPDIVLCTNMTPSRETGYENFGTLETQLNRELTAGVQRGLADFKNLNLIDFNRQFHAVRDGYDIRNSEMENIHLNIAAPDASYTSDVKTYSDFSFTLLAYTNISADILAMFNRSTVNGAPFFVKTGPGYTDTVFLTNRNASDVATSTLWLKFFCGSQAFGYNYETINTGLVLPTSAFTLNVSVRDNVFSVSFGAGDPDKVFRYKKLIRNGGWFNPKYGYWENDAVSVIIENLFLDIGVPSIVKKTITDSEIFGVYDGSAGLKYPYGGNSVNHPTSIGVNSVFKSLLDRCVLLKKNSSSASQAVQPVAITSFANGFVGNAAYGTVIRGLIHSDGTVTIEGQVSNTAASVTKGTVICTLPPDIRPASERWISTATYNIATALFSAGAVQYDPSDNTLKYLSGYSNVIGINMTFSKV